MILIVVALFSLVVAAEKMGVKVDDIGTEKETSIIIKKGSPSSACLCNKFQLVEGTEDITGDVEFSDAKAMGSWKSSCSEWKASLKEMNKENRLIAVSCGIPSAIKESLKTTYHSKGSYKIRVKMEEKKTDEQ